MEQDNSTEAGLPAQAVERWREKVFRSSLVLDYNQIIKHTPIVEKAEVGLS